VHFGVVINRLIYQQISLVPRVATGFELSNLFWNNKSSPTAVFAIFPWNACSDAKPKPKPARKKTRDPLKLARHYQAFLNNGRFESRAALALPSRSQPGQGDAGVAATQLSRNAHANPV
jgi:hypothetical protein